MELYEVEAGVDTLLQRKADEARIPIGGALELTPLCNMKCKMCYVRQTHQEMMQHGRMLTCDEWLRILNEAKEQGVLYLLITGGEPLLYPEFERLYTEISQMGFIVSINSNGTLIDEHFADLFQKYPFRRMNITLYGKDEFTYQKLCKNPEGFSNVMRAAELLKKRGLSFRFSNSITPDNIKDLPELFKIAKQFDIPLQAASYMFPAVRRNQPAELQNRLLPEEAAKAMFQAHTFMRSKEEMDIAVRRTLAKLFMPPKVLLAQGYICHAGKSGFWLNWKGEMQACGMMTHPCISLLTNDFKECWEYIVKSTSHVDYCDDCKKCSKQNICHVCTANLCAESGDSRKKPEYICRYTDELIRLQIEYLPEEERSIYYNAIKNGGFKPIL